MSQPPFDPPPLPVVPLPVEPIYPDWSSQPHRPRVVGFIGVTSIILGSICILAGICFGLIDMGLVLASNMAKTIAALPTTGPTTNPTTTGGTPERLPADGMAAVQRQVVADALSKLRPLTTNQLLQLDELLAEHGNSIVPGIAALTADQLAAGVSKAGHMTFGTGGSDYFVLGEGRLEIGDDRAVFFSSSGQPAMRSNAIQLPASTFGTTTTGLQPDQIRSVLRTISDMNGTRIKNAQLSSLADTFQNPGQSIVVPTDDGTDPAWEINSATTDSTGALTLFSKHGNTFATLSCNAAGNITHSSVTSSSTAGFAGATPPSINAKAGMTTLTLTFVQLSLAIYLLVIGILTIRSSPRGRLLHWIYVGLKLPVAAATAVASTWMWNSLLNSIPPGGTATPPGALFTVALSLGSIPIAIACVYPITLIFLLMSRGARIFYDGK